MPPGFSAPIRRDRNKHGGGVLIAVRDCFTAVEVKQPDCSAEIVWAEVSLKGGKKLYTGSFYRGNYDTDASRAHLLDQMREFDKSVSHIKSLARNSDSVTINVAGDFNLGDIDWHDESVPPGSVNKQACEVFIDTLHDHHLTQLQKEPSREDRVLDLICSNKPSLAKCVTTTPGISDHLAVVCDNNITPAYHKKAPRTVYMFSKANWGKMREAAKTFAASFITHLDQFSVDENWVRFKDHILSSVKAHVPSKTASRRQHLPWLTPELKRKTRRKHRMYRRARRNGNPGKMAEYKRFQRQTAKDIKRAKSSFVRDHICGKIGEGDTKPFWKFIKAQRQESVGIPPLKHRGSLYTDAKSKAAILLGEFKSVFSREDTSSIPWLGPNRSVKGTIPPLLIQSPGVQKLLSKLNPSKSSGPDGIAGRVLRELACELAPALTALFTQTLQQGTVPREWREAIISPIFKKGDVHNPANYRPVSLTCIVSKVMEHILCKHMLDHLEHHGALTALQHGFRRGRSCETQLLLTIDDLVRSYDRKHQVDVGILDFSRVFDTVPHERLLGKLAHCGVRGPILDWVRSFLSDRKMRVAVDGVYSPWAGVTSGVPQGTILGPLLFLIYINDLPDCVTEGTIVRLFADDCLVYRVIHSHDDQVILDKDLASLQKWSERWGMSFNPRKCNVLQVSRGDPSSHFYQLCGEVLQKVSDAKYLGILISSDLSWDKHISDVAKRANYTLGLIRRNLRHCPRDAKTTAYFSLVRSTTDYCSAIWDPYLEKDKTKLERVNRRAARVVCNKTDPLTTPASLICWGTTLGGPHWNTGDAT